MLLCLARHRADDIVGLIAVNHDNRDMVGSENTLYIRYSDEDAFGRLVAVSLVLGISLMTERRAARIKAHGDVRWLLTLEQVLEHVDKTEYGTGVNTGAGQTGVANHRIKRAEDERIGIQ